MSNGSHSQYMKTESHLILFLRRSSHRWFNQLSWWGDELLSAIVQYSLQWRILCLADGKGVCKPWVWRETWSCAPSLAASLSPAAVSRTCAVDHQPARGRGRGHSGQAGDGTSAPGHPPGSMPSQEEMKEQLHTLSLKMSSPRCKFKVTTCYTKSIPSVRYKMTISCGWNDEGTDDKC